MRILHVNDRLSARGGADWHLLGILAAQSRTHDVLLAAAGADGSAAAPCPTIFLPGLDARTRKKVVLDEPFRAFGPDLVHLHNVVNPRILEWAGNRPALVTVQDHRSFCPGRGKVRADGRVCDTPMSPETCAGCFDDARYFERIFRTTRERLEALRHLPVVVLSRYMKRELCAVGLEADRVHVVPPFVHGLEADAPATGKPCVLFVGRLVDAKGLDEARRAWSLARTGLDLVFAGTGSQRGRLEAAGHQVTGWLDHGQLSRLYRRAAAVLFPPRWQEPFGIVGLEALCMGTPVAAWKSGAVPEWHPGRGLLVERGDVEALARALDRALNQGSPPPPEGFDRARLMDRLHAVYQLLAGRSQ